jgi:transcriptional regulator with XRE-family HTH domain
MSSLERNQWALLVDTTGAETHRVDLSACWRAWRTIQGNQGRLYTRRDLAQAAEVSLETVARFMHGRGRVSIRSARRIIEALGLSFETVAEPVEVVSARAWPSQDLEFSDAT